MRLVCRKPQFSIGLERHALFLHLVINQINHGVGFAWAASVDFSNPNKMYDIFNANRQLFEFYFY